jgi:two-component system response regulator VicR
MKILIIEDSLPVVETISIALEVRWPEAKIISTHLGERGIALTKTESPDVIILDLGLPDISGFDVLKQIRLFSTMPVLILTASSDEANVVKGLEWGADDYVVKPFKQMELLARIQGIIRRHQPQSETPLTCGHLRFDPVSIRLTSGLKEIKISRTEGIILGQLIRNAGTEVSYTKLAEAMWGADFPEARDSVKVHIRHLREKLERDPANPTLIVTKPGVGYLLNKST